MTTLLSQIYDIIHEIETLKLENCGPSDDPDKQYAYTASFRDLLIRLVNTLKRLNDPVINDLLQFINENFNVGLISEAHYQKSRIIPIFDYLNEIKGNKEHPIYTFHNGNFIDKEILDKIRRLKSRKHDFRKLIKFIEELDFNYTNNNYLASLLLLRAIMNHIPPIFGFNTFSEYVANTGRSIKSVLQKLEYDARPIADMHSHYTIRKKEILPTKNQIEPFKSSMEILLHEIVVKVDEDDD